MTYTKLLLAACLVPLLGAAGCRREPPKPSVASATPAGSAVPVDRLAPGELALSQLTAFGLPLPDGMRQRARFTDSAHFEGEIQLDDLVKYLRRHAELGTGSLEGRSLVFGDVTIHRAPPGKRFRVVLTNQAPQTLFGVYDVTPPPAPVERLVDDAARWRAAGYDTRGNPLDPKSMQ